MPKSSKGSKSSSSQSQSQSRTKSPAKSAKSPKGKSSGKSPGRAKSAKSPSNKASSKATTRDQYYSSHHDPHHPPPSHPNRHPNRHPNNGAGGGSYYRNMNSEDDSETYTMDGSRRLPWYQTPSGIMISTIGAFFVVMMIMKHHRKHSNLSYSYAEECVDNLMVSVNQDCGRAIWGYDCDGTLECQVSHNNIYCAKCGCNNDLIGDLFETLPNECKQFFK